MNSNSLRLQWFLNFEMKRRLFIHKILNRWHLGRLANKLLWPTCTGWPDRCGWCVQDKFRIWCLCFNWILSVGHSARKLIFTVERTSARNAECLTYKSAEWCWEFRDCQSVRWPGCKLIFKQASKLSFQINITDTYYSGPVVGWLPF